MYKTKETLQGLDTPLNSIDGQAERPLISIVASALNEASILEDRLKTLCAYIDQLSIRYQFELILINDGSTDQTGAIMEKFAAFYPYITIYTHRRNQGLGKALQDGFSMSHGKYVISIDIDLSCSLDHIERLLDAIITTDATMVIASPTMKGGQMLNVPFRRRVLSYMANMLLSLLTFKKISNFTHMMRVYKGDFIRSTNLRSKGMDVMPEIIYKAMIRGEKIEQIPATLDWGENYKKSGRRSNMSVFKHTLATLMASFILHPFFYFIFPGMLILLFSFYPLGWIIGHFFRAYDAMPPESYTSFLDHGSQALALAYQNSPHTFFIGLMCLVLALQMIALGFLSLQNKHYYEEIFDIVSKIPKKTEEH